MHFECVLFCKLSRISEIVYPDGKSVKYTYDVLDNLKTVVDRDGNTTAYEYDAKNRVIKVTRPNGSYTTISYNELDGVSKLENNTAEGMVSSFEYKYNDKGQIVKETATNKDVKSVKEFAYDAKGELESFVENRNGLMIYTTYSYDNVGNRISKEVKKTDQNVRTNYTYNELNQLTTESEEGKSDINYSYDANGNLVAKNDGERTLTYSYTVEDRLQAVKEGNQILMAAIYDGNGDRVFTLRPSKNPPTTLIRMNNPKTGDDIIVYIAIFVAAVVVIIMFNSKNEKVKKAGIGLLTVLVVAGSATIITINSNKETESYTPNVPSNKESRQINEDMIFIPFGVNENDQNRYELTQYINDVTTQNTQVLMEYSNESGITAYTYGNERLSYETNGVNYKYNYDGRGSVTNLLDSTNTSVVEYNYQPFGETEIIGTKAQELENTYQFNAESTDALTGLQYLRARYYDSKTGRFTSQDTYLGEITDPLSRNLYLYTKNDPVNYVDPSGHSLLSIISNAVQNVVNTVKNAVTTVAKTVASAAKTVVNVVKNVVSNEKVKKVIDQATYEQNEIKRILSTKNVGVYGPVINQNTANTNPKAEKSKLLEYQIKELRKLNTKNSNEIADKLQEEMKKICDSDLIKICSYEPQTRIDGNSISFYDRNAAIQYAFKYVYTPNTNQYRYFEKGDCANFVSQSLVAGGIQPTEDWQTKQRLPFDIFGISRYEVTENWSNVTNQMEYFKDNGFVEKEYRVKSMEELREITKYIEPGDVAYISTEYENIPTHAILITAVTEDDVYYTAHTSSRKNQSIYEKYLNLDDPENIEHAKNSEDIQPLMVIYHIKNIIKK